MQFHILGIEPRPALLKPTLVAVSVFSPCQAFESLVRFRPLVQLGSNPHTLIMHSMQPPLPYYVNPVLFAIGSPLHGCFAIVRHPIMALSASATTCAVVLFGLRVGIVLIVVIGYVSVLPSLLYFCDKPSPYLLTFSLPLLNRTLPAIPAINCELSMRPTDLNAFFQCLCFVDPHYTSCSITCSFPRYSVRPISSLQLFSFPLSSCLPSPWDTFTEH
jgi:hypothetical protein